MSRARASSSRLAAPSCRAPERLLFVSLPVADLRRSTEFFRQLGFEFEPRYSDELGACMVVAPRAFVVLLSRAFFRRFIRRDICAPGRAESVLRLTCERRVDIDALIERALAAGARRDQPPLDLGHMYSAGFQDLDGHAWTLVWTSPRVAEA